MSQDDDLDRYFESHYDELRKRAARLLGLRRDALQSGDLVHSAYEKMTQSQTRPPSGRTHFLALTARAMGQVLIDQARRRSAVKRGGDRRQVSLTDRVSRAHQKAPDRAALIDFGSALERLRERRPRGYQTITLRFLGGLTNRETARELDISEAMVEKHVRHGKAFLFSERGGTGPASEDA
ncbi:MAG: sigma-70 family RNA polymerase sigma factor [Acidobacteriota bacterium]